MAEEVSLCCHGRKCGRRMVSKYQLRKQLREAQAAWSVCRCHSCRVLVLGQGIARGRSCGQGVGRGKGHALNKRALIGRWLEGDDDLMRSSPFSDSPPSSQSHHLTSTPKRFWFRIYCRRPLYLRHHQAACSTHHQ